MSDWSDYVPQVGDIVRIGKGTCQWTVTGLFTDWNDDEYANLRTGVGRLGRNGRTITAPVDGLSLFWSLGA